MSNVKHCSCKHEYQDTVYGKGMRLHTASNKGDRCTVCSTVSGTATKSATAAKSGTKK